MLGEFGHQIDDVEIVEERVDEGNDRVENAGLAGGFGHFTLRPWCPSVCLEPEPAIEDVACDVGGAAAGRVGVGTQADKRLGRL
ncbi:hypothetical protein MMOR_55200 [Mycolicibacterium moriokaense]|uniref:Uncharacterized protein n=1 Tax=Mycolicibacterium moriokaense TaxID=39691 RepID=A0AAD1HH61_9MYCO|nr:hypothetical protein MMOR_55200 [Mycolicibacterium moriokaense]